MINWLHKTFYFLESSIIYVFLFFTEKGKKLKVEVIKQLMLLKVALAQESVETKEMLGIYYHFSQGQASKEDLEKANAQFRDLLKTLGLGVFAILPFAPISIPLIVKLGHRLGIDILPSSFKDRKQRNP